MLKDYNTLNEMVKEYREDKDLYKLILNTVRFFDRAYKNNRQGPWFKKDYSWSPTPLFKVLAHYGIEHKTNNSYQMCSVDNMVDLIHTLTKADKERIRKLVWKGHYEKYYEIFAPAAVYSWAKIQGIKSDNWDYKISEYKREEE